MIRALLLGILGGFILAIPPGPLSVAVSKQGVMGNIRNGFTVALGAASMDVVLCLIATFASSAIVVTLTDLLTGNTWLPLTFQILCILVLVVLGVRFLRKKHSEAEASAMARREEMREESARQHGYSSPYLLGVVIAVVNLATPTFFPAILGFVGYVHSKGLLGGGILENLIFAGGFGVGTMIWFSSVLQALRKHREKFSLGFLANIYKFAGGAFIVFAALITYHVIMTTEWSTLL